MNADLGVRDLDEEEIVECVPGDNGDLDRRRCGGMARCVRAGVEESDTRAGAGYKREHRDGVSHRVRRD